MKRQWTDEMDARLESALPDAALAHELRVSQAAIADRRSALGLGPSAGGMGNVAHATRQLIDRIAQHHPQYRFAARVS